MTARYSIQHRWVENEWGGFDRWDIVDSEDDPRRLDGNVATCEVEDDAKMIVTALHARAKAIAEAFALGYRDGRADGPESLHVISPYDVDEETELYEAWQAGMDKAAEL